MARSLPGNRFNKLNEMCIHISVTTGKANAIMMQWIAPLLFIQPSWSLTADTIRLMKRMMAINKNWLGKLHMPVSIPKFLIPRAFNKSVMIIKNAGIAAMSNSGSDFIKNLLLFHSSPDPSIIDFITLLQYMPYSGYVVPSSYLSTPIICG